jgi:hypothetical protein
MTATLFLKEWKTGFVYQVQKVLLTLNFVREDMAPFCHLTKARPTGTCPSFTSSYIAFQEKRNQNSVPETTKYTNCLLLNLQQPSPPLVAIHKDHKKHPSSPSPSTIIYYPFNPLMLKMPLQHAVMYQAFREINNFICNNGDDWDKFCNSTA